MATLKISKERQLALLQERGISTPNDHPQTGIRNSNKKAVDKNFCKDCINCIPDIRNLSNFGLPIIGDCPYRKYKILLNHDGCQDKFKKK